MRTTVAEWPLPVAHDPKTQKGVLMSWFTSHKSEMVDPAKALAGRSSPIDMPGAHLVLSTPIASPYPVGMEQAIFAMGCFWGAERKFWVEDGVHVTAVGYSGGYTPNPTYEEVCSGKTGHAESVLVVFDPAETTYARMLAVFFESHDPTQVMRQGNDVGTQYRSAIFTTTPSQLDLANEARDAYQKELEAAGLGPIATEITPAGPFYFAEGYHQQYLAANPGGYCGLGGTGVSCPVGPFGSGI